MSAWPCDVRFCFAFLVTAGCCLFAGCASTEPQQQEGLETVGSAAVAAENVFITKPDFTPFYVLGPQQTGGPDLSLTKGARVELVRRGFGFSQVKIEDGRIGYVATEALETAPPDVVAEMTSGSGDPEPTSTAIKKVYRSGGSGSSSSGGESYALPPDLPPLPEPLNNLPPTEVPAFRY